MDTAVKSLNTEKAKALQAALAQIEKQFGKGTIMRLGEGEVIDDIEVCSTGSLGLDIALGVGGLKRVRGVEIYGQESRG
jgi:recombination protein RecA